MNEWPHGSGEMVECIRAHDWSLTALGAAESWPPCLRVTANMMLAHALPMCVLWGPDRIAIYNDAFRPLLGSEQPDLLGQPFYAARPEMRKRYEPFVVRALAGDTVFLKSADDPSAGGRWNDDTWSGATISSLRDDSDEPAGVLVTISAAIERCNGKRELRESSQQFDARTEAALLESEKKYRKLFDNMDQGFAEVELLRDREGKPVDQLLVELNPAFRHLVGIPVDLARGRTAREILPNLESWWMETYDRVLRDGKPQRFQRYVPDIHRWFDVNVVPDAGDRFVLLYDDITVQKHLETTLRASEERQAFLLKLSDAMRPLADPDAIKQMASRILGEHLGVSRVLYGEIVDETWCDIRHDYVSGVPSLHARLRIQDFGHALVDLYRRGEAVVFADVDHDPRFTPEERGTLVAIGARANLSVPLVKEGRWMAVFGVQAIEARNWTGTDLELVRETAERTWAAVERAHAEAAVRKSEENQRTLLEGIPQLVWRSRDHGFWTWSSPQWQAFTGQTLEASLGQGWLDAVHPEDIDLTLQAWKNTEQSGALDVEHRLHHAGSGEYRWHRTRSVPVRDRTGQTVDWLGTSTDTEELKRTEAVRLVAEEGFRLFVKNVQEYALVQTDAGGVITNWNPGAQRLFGFGSDQMVGSDFGALLTPEDNDAGVFRKELAFVATGHPNEDARWFVRRDGSRFWARWITEPIHDEAGEFVGLAKVMRDETERERASASTKNALAEKEHLLKEVHHRVKNNLQVITSLLNLQAAQIEDETALAAFDEARNRVASIASIHDLLYRSTSFAAIHLADYARQFSRDLVKFFGTQDRVQVEIAGDGATVELERAVPYGLMLNELLTNALKHAFPDGRRGRILLAFEQRNETIHVRISDDGVGFAPGFDVASSTTLGLKLVRRLAQQLRASLIFDLEGTGTTVDVHFPAATGT